MLYEKKLKESIYSERQINPHSGKIKNLEIELSCLSEIKNLKNIISQYSLTNVEKLEHELELAKLIEKKNEGFF